MPEQEDVEAFAVRLRIHRRTLATYLEQHAKVGAYSPPVVLFGIQEAKKEIRRIKSILREWGVSVEDLPDEDTDVNSAGNTEDNSNVKNQSKLNSLMRDNLALSKRGYFPILGLEYSRQARVLKENFVPLYGFPLQIGKPENYYPSITATILLALHHAHALSEDEYEAYYESLFWLRDNSVGTPAIIKKPEDAVAWDVQESPSVWSTYTVLWAFLGTGYEGPRINEVKEALMWLIRQQGEDGGWGFDIQCSSSTFFTAPTIHVIRLALKSNIPFTAKEIILLQRAKALGMQFLMKYYYTNDEESYGTMSLRGQNVPDATATLLILWNLFEEDSHKYQGLISSGVRYLQTHMSDGIWGFEEVVAEERMSTKYGCFKIVRSFSPSFVICLLRMGYSPFEKICIEPMLWYERNKQATGWPLPGYRNGGTFTFATAYALWSIANWNRYVIKEGRSRVLKLHGQS